MKAPPRGSQRRTGILILLLLLALLTLGTYVLLETHSPTESIMEELLLLIIGDTEYARGYSQSKFEQVTIGMCAEDVRSLLGDPLPHGNHGGSTSTCWIYTQSPTDTHYRRRWIRLEDGVVTQIDAFLYFD